MQFYLFSILMAIVQKLLRQLKRSLHMEFRRSLKQQVISTRTTNLHTRMKEHIEKFISAVVFFCKFVDIIVVSSIPEYSVFVGDTDQLSNYSLTSK